MGGGNSSHEADLQQKQADLQKKQDDLTMECTMLKALLLQQHAQHKKEQEQMVEKMSLLLLALLQKKSDDNVIHNEEKDIEIEGVNYHIYQFVDKGGFGRIYKARTSNNHEVALKLLQNTQAIQDQIQSEIRFLQTIRQIPCQNHPVIEYYGSLTTDTGIYIALELADCDLYTFWVNKVAKAQNDEKFILGVLIFICVLRALIFLEQLKIVHGDIKPQNLVIVERDNSFCIKLIDFGTVEKLDTKRSQITIGQGKAHTQFFVSPEYLKRDGNNKRQYRLHKKSDAWAAGVMFYYLLYDAMPWENEYKYDDFINDPAIQDIKAPDKDNFNDIIQLLLKKDPEERSSAADAMKAMKGHAKINITLQALEAKFYPMDDVCQLVVPNEIRTQFRKREQIRQQC